MHGKHDVLSLCQPTRPTRPRRSLRPASTRRPPMNPRGAAAGSSSSLLLLLLVGGGAAYYFLIFKPSAPAAARHDSHPGEDGDACERGSFTHPDCFQQGRIQQRRAHAVHQAGRQMSSSPCATRRPRPFTEAFSALNAAGGFSAVGLASKEAIAARRDLVAKCQTANDDMRELRSKPRRPSYRAELAKTPLSPHDVDSPCDDFASRRRRRKHQAARTPARFAQDRRRHAGLPGQNHMAAGAINGGQALAFTKKPARPEYVHRARRRPTPTRWPRSTALQKEIKDDHRSERHAAGGHARPPAPTASARRRPRRPRSPPRASRTERGVRPHHSEDLQKRDFQGERFLDVAVQVLAQLFDCRQPPQDPAVGSRRASAAAPGEVGAPSPPPARAARRPTSAPELSTRRRARRRSAPR